MKQVAVIIEAYHFYHLDKIVIHIVLSSLTPYAYEIIGDRQCEFRCNRSTADHIFCLHQILEKKWEYN